MLLGDSSNGGREDTNQLIRDEEGDAATLVGYVGLASTLG